MIELDKRDIEGIARRRFMNHHQWHFLGCILGSLAVGIGVMLAFGDKAAEGFSMRNLIVAAPLVVGMIGGMFLWQRAENKAVKAFVKECEDNPALSYVGEPFKKLVSNSK